MQSILILRHRLMKDLALKLQWLLLDSKANVSEAEHPLLM